jgi:hypothetical protein
MYLQKVGTIINKKTYFVLASCQSSTNEKSRNRIRIRTKMSRIHNPGFSLADDATYKKTGKTVNLKSGKAACTPLNLVHCGGVPHNLDHPHLYHR